MNTRNTSLLHDERGAAMSEAIILALFFTFVFAAIMYMHAVFNARLATDHEVRACAWAYTRGGCKELPASCAGAVPTSGLSPVGLDQWNQENGKEAGGGAAGGVTGAIKDGAQFLHKMMGALPILGKQTTIKKSQSVSRSPLLGGGSGVVGASYAIFCNERTTEDSTMVEEAFCRVMPDGFPGC
jgi:hypothetical protein